MKRQADRKPHEFGPGKDPKFPGPYCRFCHYSVAYADNQGCPKRTRRQADRITDKQRLDFMDTNPGKVSHARGLLGESDSWAYDSGHRVIKTRSTLRAAVDAAIRASRRGTGK